MAMTISSGSENCRRRSLSSACRGNQLDPIEIGTPLARVAVRRHVGVQESVQVGARLLDSRLRPESSDHAQPPDLLRPQLVAGQHHRHGDVDRRTDLQPEELRLADADDRDPVGADLDALAEHGGIQAEASFP